MAFSQKEWQQHRVVIEAYLEKRRPPLHLRTQVDLSYRTYKQSIELFEIRSKFNDPYTTVENPIVKTTWVKTQKVWRIFWQRANRKWHRYDPTSEVKTLQEVMHIVETDKYGCFYG